MAATGTFVLVLKMIEHESAVTTMQLLDQPPKVEPVAGEAVKVTVVPIANVAEQPTLEVQLMPTGELVTVPTPRPISETVTVGTWPPPEAWTVRLEVPAMSAPLFDLAIAVMVV